MLVDTISLELFSNTENWKGQGEIFLHDWFWMLRNFDIRHREFLFSTQPYRLQENRFVWVKRGWASYSFNLVDYEPMAQAMPERFAMGVSAMTALDDGRLLVLEREFAVPESIIGAFVSCRLYQVCPDKEEPVLATESIVGRKPMGKTLLAEWMTAVGTNP